MGSLVEGLSISTFAYDWLRHTKKASVLHLFPEVINLVNSQDEVFSIVTPAVGNGPFSLVVNLERLDGLVQVKDKVDVTGTSLLLAGNRIELGSAKEWNPKPLWGEIPRRNWQSVCEEIEELLLAGSSRGGFVKVLFSKEEQKRGGNDIFYQRMRAGADQILGALLESNIEILRKSAAALSGLGVGLTPAGDDYLIGVMYALWVIKGESEAVALSDAILKGAEGRTSRLSLAWLRAARNGLAGEKWHQLVQAVKGADRIEISLALERILNTGETSGADALSGFVQVMTLERLK